MSTETYVGSLPTCDICQYEKGKPGVPAEYDGKTKGGPWANMCPADFATYGVGLGTGKGQHLIVGDEPEGDPVAEFQTALENGASLDELEDLIGDGDILDFI